MWLQSAMTLPSVNRHTLPHHWAGCRWMRLAKGSRRNNFTCWVIRRLGMARRAGEGILGVFQARATPPDGMNEQPKCEIIFAGVLRAPVFVFSYRHGWGAFAGGFCALF